MADERGLDVDELLRVARDRSSEGRRQLVDTIADLFEGDAGLLSARERALMNDILRQLVHEVEISVRKHLAIRLSDTAEAPHDLVLTLANDDAEVAHPILLRSTVLRDAELIEIVRHRTLQHQLAVAMRATVSEAVSDALVERGEASVVTALLENPNARIAAGTMEYLVEQSRRVDEWQNPLLHRADLPAPLARRMFWWVSAALRVHIAARYALDAGELDDLLEAAVDDVMRQGEEDAREGASAADRLAGQLVEARGRPADLLVRVLRQGEVTLFEALLARMARLRPILVRRMIYEPGGEGLAAICRAVDVDREAFGSIWLLSRRARSGANAVGDDEISAALGFFDRIDRQAADRIVQRWRRNPDYLDLLRRVETVRQGSG
ncbi:MAG: DUF2336 domain-containing protein [Alphaproteobacteria bacterium]